jgi:hypothetical protein
MKGLICKIFVIPSPSFFNLQCALHARLRTHANEINKNQLRKNTIKQTKDQNVYICINRSVKNDKSQDETEGKHRTKF